MEYITYFRTAPTRPDAEPYQFSTVRGHYDTPAFAIEQAKRNADLPKMGAHSFLLEAATGAPLGVWTRDGEGWVRADR